MKYSGKINLKQFAKSFVSDIKGNTETKRCICIPIADNNLFVGEKGVYFDFNAREIKEENRKSGDSHIIVQSLPKEVYESLYDEQRKSQPIFGNMKEFQAQIEVVNASVENNDDLPF